MGLKHDIELVDLDDERATPSLIGAKAGHLAEARRRGMAALPGFVVLPGPGRSLVAELLPEVVQRGPHAVSLSLMERVPDEVHMSAAVERARSLGPSLVARSSSAVEDDPVWSGAFSSFLDLGPDQLTTAVAGCWASTITRSVLEICERTGADPSEVCPAVLVQPMIDPQASGTARYLATSGPVEIVAVWGSPAPLMAGWSEGWQATVVGDEVSGPAVGTEPSSRGGRGRVPDKPFPAEWMQGVADLARHACEGSPSAIEWAVVDDRPVLLQARPTTEGYRPVSDAAPGGGTSDGGTRHGDGGIPEGAALLPPAVRAARAVARFGGPLGDELVLPWLLAGPDVELEGPSSAGVGFEETVASARALVAEAMGATPAEAGVAAAHLLARISAGELQALEAVRPVDVGPAGTVLSQLFAAGADLVEAGVLAHVEQLWSLSVAEVRELLRHPAAGGWHGHRHRTLRWQALIQRVVTVRGRGILGEGVSPGVAAGHARRLASSRDLRRVVPGDVVVLHRPSPQLAPALWVASGLVAESGSGAAHLIEVARSLRVPAVVGAGTIDVTEGEDLLVVDGDEGHIALLPADRDGEGREAGVR